MIGKTFPSDTLAQVHAVPAFNLQKAVSTTIRNFDRIGRAPFTLHHQPPRLGA